LDDNAIEVTMSIPLKGELAETLLQLSPVTVSQSAMSPPESAVGTSSQYMTPQAKALEVRQDDMSGPSTTLESGASPVTPSTQPPAISVPAEYTGLLIDARGAGFQPSLKPNIYCRQKLLYPGACAGQTEAIDNGYVRYFRNMSEARASERISPRPYTVKALKTSEGQRSLILSSEAFDLLQTVVQTPDNFISGRRVVIVY
jgi:hypothetical protein